MTTTACKIAEGYDERDTLAAGNFHQAGKFSPPRVLVVDDEPEMLSKPFELNELGRLVNPDYRPDHC